MITLCSLNFVTRVTFFLLNHSKSSISYHDQDKTKSL